MIPSTTARPTASLGPPGAWMRAGKRQLFYPLTDSYYRNCIEERKKTQIASGTGIGTNISTKTGALSICPGETTTKKPSHSLHGACTKNIGTPTIHASQLHMRRGVPLESFSGSRPCSPLSFATLSAKASMKASSSSLARMDLDWLLSPEHPAVTNQCGDLVKRTTQESDHRPCANSWRQHRAPIYCTWAAC
jgi:hypothetical protein